MAWGMGESQRAYPSVKIQGLDAPAARSHSIDELKILHFDQLLVGAEVPSASFLSPQESSAVGHIVVRPGCFLGTAAGEKTCGLSPESELATHPRVSEPRLPAPPPPAQPRLPWTPPGSHRLAWSFSLEKKVAKNEVFGH